MWREITAIMGGQRCSRFQSCPAGITALSARPGSPCPQPFSELTIPTSVPQNLPSK